MPSVSNLQLCSNDDQALAILITSLLEVQSVVDLKYTNIILLSMKNKWQYFCFITLK